MSFGSAEPVDQSVDGFVLAGGRSSRMGRDKALVQLAGRPLIEWVLHALRESGLSARIAGARPEAIETLARFAPLVLDEKPDAGPLGGICSALRQSEAKLAVFVPVDLPLISSGLIRYLIWHAQITRAPAAVYSLNGFAQTFPAVVRRDALALLAAELESDRSGCFAAFRAAGVSVVPVEMVVQAGHVTDPRGWPAFRWFSGMNTPEELEHAEMLLR